MRNLQKKAIRSYSSDFETEIKDLKMINLPTGCHAPPIWGHSYEIIIVHITRKQLKYTCHCGKAILQHDKSNGVLVTSWSADDFEIPEFWMI